MESLILGLFLAQLIACLALGIDLLWALSVGYVLFWGYGVLRGHGPLGVVKMSLGGIGKVKNVLITFIFIGMLTATWRASGTLAAIICYAARAIRPDIFLLLTFLLNCGVSFLTGTAFGTSATMGMVCMTMAAAMGLWSQLCLQNETQSLYRKTIALQTQVENRDLAQARNSAEELLSRWDRAEPRLCLFLNHNTLEECRKLIVLLPGLCTEENAGTAAALCRSLQDSLQSLAQAEQFLWENIL